MSADAILTQLRRGTRTTSELMLATGLSRNGVSCSIRDANASGFLIVNVRGRHGQQDGLYWLSHDAEHPRPRVCAFGGCRTILSASNTTPFCRSHLPEVAYLAVLQHLDEILDGLLDPEPAQLALLLEVSA